MKPGGGKNKGSAFERRVAEALSLWVSGGKRKDLFWRSAISGGRATQRNKKGEQIRTQLGDICAVDPLGNGLTDKYFIELKHYKDLEISSFLLRGTGLLASFWLKASAEAAKYNRLPLLIARQNNYPIFVLLSAYDPCLIDVFPQAYVGGTLHCKLMLFDDFIKIPISDVLLEKAKRRI